jgi:Trp operon repressor
MQKLVYTNEELRNRLINIMDKAISEKSDLLTLMIQNAEKETVEDKRHILERLKFGFTDEIN